MVEILGFEDSPLNVFSIGLVEEVEKTKFF
jgi:hypothetical protein